MFEQQDKTDGYTVCIDYNGENLFFIGCIEFLGPCSNREIRHKFHNGVCCDFVCQINLNDPKYCPIERVRNLNQLNMCFFLFNGKDYCGSLNV